MNLGAPIAVGFWVLLALWVAVGLYRDMRDKSRATRSKRPLGRSGEGEPGLLEALGEADGKAFLKGTPQGGPRGGGRLRRGGLERRR